MEGKQFLDADGLAYFYEQAKSRQFKLYLHKLKFKQEITSPEGEPFENVYLYLVTTDPTPAVISDQGYNLFGNLNIKLGASHILSAHAGWAMGDRAYYIPVQLCINMQHGDIGVGGWTGTYIEKVIIPQMVASGSFEGESSPEVIIYDSRKFIGDTVTEI